MTRWKRNPTATLILMHAHNQWSMWDDCLLTAASNLGLPVGSTQYLNCSGDGSWDVEWYTSDTALARVGGMDALQDAANELR